MKLRTELQFSPSDWRIHHDTGTIALGSCFAAEMGAQLQSHKFSCLLNPFGITYHPLPLLEAVDLMLDGPAHAETFQKSIFQDATGWASFLFHSEMLRDSENAFLNHVNEKSEEFKESFLGCRYLIITMGTALSFHHRSLDMPVANCHRHPQQDFERRLNSVSQLTKAFKASLERWQRLNPGLKVILTVSPVRHIRSGMVENGASKATLRVLCQQLEEEFESVRYFPAYEIMVDDLRDYRFYQEDLVHPSAVAVDYIWEAFGKVYFGEGVQEINRAIQKIRKDLEHRPRNPRREAYRKFLNQVETKISSLESKLNMDGERKIIERLLSDL